MSFAAPEIEQTAPCPVCTCRAVFHDLATPGEREQPVFLRCCHCGQERAALDFYEQSAA